MKTNDITISPRSRARLQMQAYLSTYTREPRGSEVEWQKKLASLDSELVLRWSYLQNQYVVFYDHHGMMSVIRTFKPGEFGKEFLNIRHNATMNTRKLRQMKKEYDEGLEKQTDREINDCGEEFGIELHHATKGRMITDSVDMYGPKKPKLGGVIL